VFKRETLPGLQRFTLAALAETTGLSKGYCARIRKGEVVPHPRHWEALQELAAAEVG
jgi:predicted transcriptional regulator